MPLVYEEIGTKKKKQQTISHCIYINFSKCSVGIPGISFSCVYVMLQTESGVLVFASRMMFGPTLNVTV